MTDQSTSRKKECQHKENRREGWLDSSAAEHLPAIPNALQKEKTPMEMLGCAVSFQQDHPVSLSTGSSPGWGAHADRKSQVTSTMPGDTLR